MATEDDLLTPTIYKACFNNTDPTAHTDTATLECTTQSDTQKWVCWGFNVVTLTSISADNVPQKRSKKLTASYSFI